MRELAWWVFVPALVVILLTMNTILGMRLDATEQRVTLVAQACVFVIGFLVRR